MLLPRFPSRRPTETSAEELTEEFDNALVRFATEGRFLKRAAHTRLYRYGDVYTLHFTALLFCAASIIVGELWNELSVKDTNYYADTNRVAKKGAAGREEAAFAMCGRLLGAYTRYPMNRQKLSSCVVAPPPPHTPPPTPSAFLSAAPPCLGVLPTTNR